MDGDSGRRDGRRTAAALFKDAASGELGDMVRRLNLPALRARGRLFAFLRYRAFARCADWTAVALGSGLKKQKIGRQQQGAPSGIPWKIWFSVST
jgi:hypothetical protein